MEQNDIFHLLLLILLLSNEEGNGCNGRSRLGSINDAIILCLLLYSCDGNTSCRGITAATTF